MLMGRGPGKGHALPTSDSKSDSSDKSHTVWSNQNVPFWRSQMLLKERVKENADFMCPHASHRGNRNVNANLMTILTVEQEHGYGMKGS